MARTRALYPGFFLDDELAEIEPLGRLLFAGLWVIADREGRLKDNPRRIKAEILPYDVCNVEELIHRLSTGGFIHRYEVDGSRYIAIPTWHRYQNPHHREAESIIPPCMDDAWLKHENLGSHGSVMHERNTNTNTNTNKDASPNKDLCPKCRKGHHDIELSYDEDGKLHCALCGYRKRGK